MNESIEHKAEQADTSKTESGPFVALLILMPVAFFVWELAYYETIFAVLAEQSQVCDSGASGAVDCIEFVFTWLMSMGLLAALNLAAAVLLLGTIALAIKDQK
ncbi:hypothetical protein HMPREF1487_09181 [Pseudomonas sp. HPB0071]|uniref:hypothetical protein n=1 Tax=unclassified Pseudomonas TaxID=196821 RepID=UPI0002CC60E0|nr:MULTISPECIES: hypothetical protein [unclassified Pseudomonas]ENA27525.1 hypothetical protein HMPREF1487_09181 [Pseudomonas sp. HPB0071]